MNARVRAKADDASMALNRMAEAVIEGRWWVHEIDWWLDGSPVILLFLFHAETRAETRKIN